MDGKFKQKANACLQMNHKRIIYKLQAIFIRELEDESLEPIAKAHLVAGCPNAPAARGSALVRPVPAVGRAVAPPRRGQTGALVRAPELPRRARVAAVGLVRGRGAR